MRHGINITTNQRLSPTFRGNGNTIIVGDSQTSPLPIFPEGVGGGGGGASVHKLKFAQWRVADPVAFYTRRTTIIFGISGYVKFVTLYYHAIFWETEGFGEGCVKIMQIVSCLELMTNLFIFIHNGGIQKFYTAPT